MLLSLITFITRSIAEAFFWPASVTPSTFLVWSLAMRLLVLTSPTASVVCWMALAISRTESAWLWAPSETWLIAALAWPTAAAT